MLSHLRSTVHPRSKSGSFIKGLLFSLLFCAYGSAVAQDTTKSTSNTNTATAKHELPEHVINRFGTPPAVPTGELTDSVVAALDVAFGDSFKSGRWGTEQQAALETITASKDARLAWLISDLMRIAASTELNAQLAKSASQLLNIEYTDGNIWGHTTDQLIILGRCSN